MRMTKLGALMIAGLTAILIPAVNSALAQTASLQGQVTSPENTPMEGVLVSAKKEGSTITMTVVSDEKGHYAFPAGRLEPGRYSLRIRAIGYELDSPAALDIAAGQDASTDIKLRAAGDVASQMTNTEWLLSLDASDGQKRALYSCTSCHTYERILKSSHSADEFIKDVFPRMSGYSSQANPLIPQRRVVPRDMSRFYTTQFSKLAEMLAKHNLSETPQWDYSLKTLPRPSGRATKVIVTEYDLPRPTIQPHDVVLDREGTVWFSNFGENALGRMDPKTGQVTEYPYQGHRPGYANGNLDLEFDDNGTIWLGLMNQTGFASFDRASGTFKMTPLPQHLLDDSTQTAMVGATHWQVDGKIWFNDAENTQIGRYDSKTGTFDPWLRPFSELPKGPHSVYGLYADSKNNLYFCDFSSEYIGRVDAQTGQVTFFQTLTKNSRPRRGRMDAQDRLWFAEWNGDAVGMLDTKTGQFKEWKLTTPHAAPYDAVADKTEHVWTAGMMSDRVTRIDTKTGDIVEYLLPRETNVRRVFVDNSTTPPTFWTGNNHGASIVKVEPLD